MPNPTVVEKVPEGLRQIVCSPGYIALNLSPQSQLDSNYLSVCVFQLCKESTQRYERKTAVDELLRNLIDEVCRYEDPSPERQKALNGLLRVIQQLPGIYKSSHQDYLQALNQTWEWVSRNIDTFEPRSSSGRDRISPTTPQEPAVAASSPSVQQSLVTWINGYLKWRIRDLYASENQYSISLDRPISNDEGDQISRIEQLPDPTITLDLLEVKIVQIQEAERQRLGQRVRQYIEQDEQGILTGCHPRSCPKCNCQLLARRLLLQEPPQRIADIAREFNANNQTLYSHWKKHCLPRLQDIGRKFGY
jgi:hypothetical protein